MVSTTATTQSDCTDGSCVSIAVIEVLEQDSRIDPRDTGFRLYDLIDPDALDTLFSCQQTAGLAVEFDIDDVTVSISQVDDDIQVQVTDTLE